MIGTRTVLRRREFFEGGRAQVRLWWVWAGPRDKTRFSWIGAGSNHGSEGVVAGSDPAEGVFCRG